MMVRNLVCMLAVAWMSLGFANAQLRLSEVLFNPPGSPDVGREFVEIFSFQPNYPLTNIWVIGIDGDGEFNPGGIHWAINLSSLSTGNNGVLLIRDGSDVLVPAPGSDTAVFVLNNAFTAAGISNDSYTIAIVCGFTGQPGADIDLDDDGVIDNVLWTRAFDAIGWVDGNEQFPGVPDHSYGAALNGRDVPIEARIISGDVWEPDAYFWFGGDNWLAADVGRCIGAGTLGPYCVDLAEQVINGTMPEGYTQMTPGNPNPGKSATVEGDVDGNGCTDDTDLLAVLFAFGEQGCASPADLNNDGTVDDSDLLIILFNFGEGC